MDTKEIIEKIVYLKTHEQTCEVKKQIQKLQQLLDKKS